VSERSLITLNYLTNRSIKQPWSIINTMPKLITVLSLLLVCTACSHQTQTITASGKSKLVTEEIIDNKQCNHFKIDLHLASVSNVEIDKIYNDATEAHCINKDI
jgi:hypothetical protein